MMRSSCLQACAALQATLAEAASASSAVTAKINLMTETEGRVAIKSYLAGITEARSHWYQQNNTRA